MFVTSQYEYPSLVKQKISKVFERPSTNQRALLWKSHKSQFDLFYFCLVLKFRSNVELIKYFIPNLFYFNLFSFVNFLSVLEKIFLLYYINFTGNNQCCASPPPLRDMNKSVGQTSEVPSSSSAAGERERSQPRQATARAARHKDAISGASSLSVKTSKTGVSKLQTASEPGSRSASSSPSR